MDLYQKGGVHTQKVKTIFGLAALLALGAILCCCVCVADDNVDADNATYDIEGLVTYCKTSANVSVKATGDQKYYVYGILEDNNGKEQSHDDVTLSYSATTGYYNTLSFTAPETAGNYRVHATFYTSDTMEEKVGEKVIPLKVVDPIKISITLSNDSASDISLSVYLTVNGEKVDTDTITVAAATVSNGKTTPGTYTYTYDYVTENVKDTKYSLNTDSQFIASQITGLGVEHTYYSSDNDYTATTVLAIVVLVLILVVMFYIFRKPVVNKGKPKGRR